MATMATPATPLSLPTGALAAAKAPTAALTAGATSWAQYLQAMHNTCTPTMLKSVLNLDAKAAEVIHGNMVSQGIIRDGNQVVQKVKDHVKSYLEGDDMPQTRPAVSDDLEVLTDIWFAGWYEAHAAHVSNDLIALRDRDSLRIRMERMLVDTDVVGPVGAPVGFCTIAGDEIYQFYVAPEARGNGTADALLAAGEKRLIAAGIDEGQIYVLPENPRAQAFYRRGGWADDVVQEVPLQTLGDPYMQRCLIMKKHFK